MGLDKSVLLTRTITAVVFAVVMLLGLLTHEFAFISLCTLIAFGCVHELWRLSKKQSNYNLTALRILGTLFILLSLSLYLLSGFEPQSKAENPGEYFAVIPCCIIFSIWINDTMAYIVGSLIGKTTLSKISPKKTVEGTVGGAVLALLIIGFLFKYLPFEKNALPAIFNGDSLFNAGFGLIALVAAVFGTLGDLVESKLKRKANVKDSGSFMPGHGGFLDRFDSLLMAGPACYLLLQVVK